MSKNIKCCLIFILFLILLRIVKSDLKSDIKRTVKELQERRRRLYGDAQKRAVKQWELETDDPLSYPNGNKQKLSKISQLWSEYYHCTSRLVEGLTSSGRLPSVNVIAYSGTAAVLPCGLCVAPGEMGHVAWFYAKSTQNQTYTPVAEKSNLVSNINITIYNVQSEDSGVYRCQLGTSIGGLIVLEVLNDEEYVVINSQSAYPASQSVLTPDLMVYTTWSSWSKCSRCNHVGIRRRHGMCYVQFANDNVIVTTTKDKPKITTKGNTISKDVTLKLFQATSEFPNGIGCRSHLLPYAYRNHVTVNARKNVIMVEACKVPCKEIFEIRSKDGKLIERANNSAGVYSLNQRPLPQPPEPVRDIIFVEYGQKLTLICPGTTLRDVPITWRVGTKYFDGETIAKETKGRIYLTARDQIVFSSVDDCDSNVYSCWQSLNLAGVVKLQVWRDARFANGRPIAIISLIVLIIALRFAMCVLRSKLRRIP